MDLRKNHRGAYLSLSSLILSVLLVLTLFQGCGKTGTTDSHGEYHTVTVNGQTWNILDREYTWEYDLQQIRFTSTVGEKQKDGEVLIFVDSWTPIPTGFAQETVFDRAGYEAYCEKWGLTPAFPKHRGNFAVVACGNTYSIDCEVQLGDVVVSDRSVTLILRDRLTGIIMGKFDSRGFVLTVPVPETVTELKTEELYDQTEYKNLVQYGNPWGADWEIQVPEKPVIYLYPEAETAVTVKLDYDGELTCTYPAYGDGWTVTAAPDGTLTDAAGQTYSYLYWEGLGEGSWDFSKGFCVRGADTAAFLEEALADLGLTRREANEFIVYWLPRMEGNPWNLISFQNEVYTDRARLTVDPAPDTVIRVFMAWQALEAPIDIEPQALEAPGRSGFTLVEWGGAEQLKVEN